MIDYRKNKSLLLHNDGVSLIELLFVMLIFAVVMAGLYSAYTVQLKQTITEYKLSQSEMEFQIGKSIIERDLAMVGFGMADDYLTLFSPRVIEADNGNPDRLTMRGTALGRGSRASQGWSYVVDSNPTTTFGYHEWTDDMREAPRVNDRIIYIEPNLKKLVAVDASQPVNGDTGLRWLFPYPGTGSQSPYPVPLDQGVVAYGLETNQTDPSKYADYPYYEVVYKLSGTDLPPYCEQGSKNLVRSENKKIANPDTGQPLMNCVLDFEVAFGLDKNEDGLIDCWDNGGVEAASYPRDVLKTRIKQIKVYILVQQGNKDPKYFYMGTDTGLSENQVRVGDGVLTSCNGGVVGGTVTLTDPQRQYRWKMISLSISPRNIR